MLLVVVVLLELVVFVLSALLLFMALPSTITTGSSLLFNLVPLVIATPVGITVLPSEVVLATVATPVSLLLVLSGVVVVSFSTPPTYSLPSVGVSALATVWKKVFLPDVLVVVLGAASSFVCVV